MVTAGGVDRGQRHGCRERHTGTVRCSFVRRVLRQTGRHGKPGSGHVKRATAPFL